MGPSPWLIAFHNKGRVSATWSSSPREWRSITAETLVHVVCVVSSTNADTSRATHSVLISSYLWPLFEPSRHRMNCMRSLGGKFAEGFFDDVTVLQFVTNTTEGKPFQRGNIVLDKGEHMGFQGSLGDSNEHTLSASRYIDLGEGRGTS